MQSDQIGITYLDYYIPTTTVSVNEVFELMQAQGVIVFPEDVACSKELFILELKRGLECQNVPVEFGTNGYGMIDTLLTKYRQRFPDNDIDLIIFSGNFSPLTDGYSTPHRLIEKHQLESAYIFEAGNRCCSISTAMQLAKMYLTTNRESRRALIVSQNLIRNMADRFHQGNSIEGDGASLAVIESASTNVIQAHEFRNAGKFNRYLFDNSLKEVSSLFIQYAGIGASLAHQMMARHSLTPADIDQVIIQNMSTIMARITSRKTGIPEGKIFTKNITKYGHISDLDFIINLKDYLATCEAGGKILCQNTGAGLTADVTLIVNARSI